MPAGQWYACDVIAFPMHFSQVAMQWKPWWPGMADVQATSAKRCAVSAIQFKLVHLPCLEVTSTIPLIRGHQQASVPPSLT